MNHNDFYGWTSAISSAGPIRQDLLFWGYKFEEAIRVADAIRDCTDSELRSRIASLHILENSEQTRAVKYLAELRLSRAKLRRINKSDPIRKKYDELIRRSIRYMRERQSIELALHARLYLKDPKGIIPLLFWCCNLDYADRALDNMRKRYPD